jgi:hypothetical protein
MVVLPHAYSGSADVDAVVAAFVLAAARASVSTGSIGRADSSATGSVRAYGEWEVRGDTRDQTCFHFAR